MGEAAEMMLNGTVCQGCGEPLHERPGGAGVPGFCVECGDDEDEDFSAEFDADMARLDAEEAQNLAALKLAEALIASLDQSLRPGTAEALAAVRTAIANAQAWS